MIDGPNSRLRAMQYAGRVRNSLGILAKLIDSGSEELWPIFEKLESELLTIEQRQYRLSNYFNNQ